MHRKPLPILNGNSSVSGRKIDVHLVFVFPFWITELGSAKSATLFTPDRNWKRFSTVQRAGDVLMRVGEGGDLSN